MTTLFAELKSLLDQPCPTWMLWATFLIPLAIAYLVHIPNSRVLRVGLYPIAVLCMAWSIATIQTSRAKSFYYPIFSTILVLGSTPHFAFALHPPHYHPLPRTPVFPILRNSTLFKALDLCINAHRLIGIHPFQPPLAATTGSYPQLRGATYHLLGMIRSHAMHDFCCYLPMRLAPETFGSIHHIGGNYNLWCRDLSRQSGIPLLIIRVFFAATVVAIPHFGVKGFWHTIGFIGTATGFYLPEEFPQPTHWPMFSPSLNDLWGHRWHDMNRLIYTTIPAPLRLPRPLQMLAVFLTSAVHHAVIYYPPKGEWVLRPYLIFFLGSGMGCLAERTYYKLTGRKVGGVMGWIWTCTVSYIVGQPMVEHEYSSGWISIATWLVYIVGKGPSPAEISGSST